MKLSHVRVLAVFLALALMILSLRVSAQELPQAEKIIDSNVETPNNLPKLGDIIPLATELTIRLVNLESIMKDWLDASTVENKYDEIQTKIDDIDQQFKRLKDSEDYRKQMSWDLSNQIKQEIKSLEETSRPVKQAIRQLGDFRVEWLAEKKQWNEWQNILIQKRGLDQLESTFKKANITIEKALNLVLPQLDEMFRIQEKGSTIDSELKILTNELAGLIAEERSSALVKEIPPLLSLRFFSQFIDSEFWNEVKNGFYQSSWPSGRFFSQHGWIILLQGLISLFVIIAIYKNQVMLKESKRWHFLGKRIFSTGLLLGYMITVFIYDKQGAPVIFKQAIAIVGLISFSRLLGSLIEVSWKKHFIYGLTIVLVVNAFMEMFSSPLPLFRLYTVATALVAITICFRWAKESARLKESRIYSWSLRLASLFFAVILIAEVWGKAPLPLYLLTSFMRSAVAVLLFMLLMYMIRGGLEWLFHNSPMRLTSSIYSDTSNLIRRVGLFVDIAIWGLVVVPSVFEIWGVYGSFQEALNGLLGLGFNLGEQHISIGLLIIATGFFYSSFLLSWILQNLLLDKFLLSKRAERGVRVSIKRLVHYVLISFGFLLAISSLGFGLTKLTIILSALGVGIGFGLQGVVNNFVSGLILLFERPVRVGDYIELNGNWCEIENIGLRATTVQTFDQANVIIPNADLVANQVTNWTLRNRRARLIIPVGVAYGSDIPLVIETLKASADPHPMVAKDHAPQVLFLSFGESTLDFELRVWVLDVDQRLTTRSELHQEIDRRFREAEIEIAFPQRDFHLRSVDESIKLRSSDAIK